MKRSLKLSILAGLMVLLVLVVPSVSAFEISGMYTEEGQKWLNEHWGEKITIGQLEQIAYSKEVLEKIEANVPKDQLDKIRSEPYYWGERYPPEVVTPGPKIFDENSQLVEDPDGSILAGILSGSDKAPLSGIIVDAAPVGYDGTYITHSGSGKVYGADPVGSLRVESQLYGNGDWLQTAYNVKYNYPNPSPYVTVTASGIRSPVHDTLYQSQTVAQSTNPTHSASTWSFSYYYP
jgi:hypothetical protein